MTNEEILKHSLLITQGIVYGDTVPVMPYYDFPEKSSNIDQWGSPVWRLSGFPKAVTAQANHAGTMTDCGPVQFITWAGSAKVGITGSEWWEQCMTLFMRHV